MGFLYYIINFLGQFICAFLQKKKKLTRDYYSRKKYFLCIFFPKIVLLSFCNNLKILIGVEILKKFVLSLVVSSGLILASHVTNANAEENSKNEFEGWTSSDYAEYEQGKKDYEELINLEKEGKSLNKNTEQSGQSEEVTPFAEPKPDGSMGITGSVLITMSGGSSSGSSWVGGHAAIVVDQYSTIESFGNQKVASKNGVRYWTNNFRQRYPDATRHDVIGATASEKKSAVGLAKSFLNKPYNFAFGNKTTTDKFYCSQLVWRAWQLMGYDLDYNRGKFVWPGDLKKSSLLN
ncbi:hypothetical protein B5V89_03790 [Heyndrickxia sporothermodurans]|nr:hypothetical protein B5V89_03790 [Heyndrickxia sporothermodurans]